MGVKRSKNVKNICFINTILNRMKRFTGKKCSKVATNTCARTKRNIVNKEILKNKKSFAHI